MPDPSPYFNCGELKPIRINTFPGGPTGGGGGSTQPQDPNTYVAIIRPPRGQNQPRPETWVCTCKGPMENRGCINVADRECVRIGFGFPGLITPASTDVYSSKAACEADAFDKYPCALSIAECIASPVNCPIIQGEFGSLDPVQLTIFDRTCVALPPARNRSLIPNPQYATIAECLRFCLDDECEYPPPIDGFKCTVEERRCPDNIFETYLIKRCERCDRRIDPDCRFTTIEECQEVCISTGCQTEIEESGFKCIETGELPCDSESTSEVRRKTRDCISCIRRRIVRTRTPDGTGGFIVRDIVTEVDPDCKYDSLNSCRRYCPSDECGFTCTSDQVVCIDPTTQQQTTYSGGRCQQCIKQIGRAHV